MHICGFDFDVVHMEDDSFFLENRFSTFDRDLKNTKIMVPMNPEGVHGQPPGLPNYWAILRPQSKQHHNRFSHLCPGDHRVFLYFTMGACFSQKRDLDLHLKHHS